MMYTIDNPKAVKLFINPEEPNFTGVIKDDYNYIVYYLNGKYHREDGPALIFPTGYVGYYVNGKLHREDGAAVIYLNGSKQYWLNHKILSISTDQELKEYLLLRMFE